MTFPELKFKDYLHPKPKPSGLDVQCKLQHFALITYVVDPARFKEMIPARFKFRHGTVPRQTTCTNVGSPLHRCRFSAPQFTLFQNSPWGKPIIGST